MYFPETFVDPCQFGIKDNQMIRKFSRRARRYILAYFYLEHEQENYTNEDGLSEINIERMQKEFKTHRSAIDFDEKFINHCFRCHESVPHAVSRHTVNKNS